MFANSIFGNWTVHDGDARSFMGSNRVQLIFEDNKGATIDKALRYSWVPYTV